MLACTAVAITNSTPYKAWASNGNGRGDYATDPHAFADISMAAGTSTQFKIHAYEADADHTSTKPFPVSGPANICIFDFDTGARTDAVPGGVLAEEFAACGLMDWFTHDHPPKRACDATYPDEFDDDFSGCIDASGLCPNIDTSEYLDVLEDRVEPEYCVRIRAKMEGTGHDNPDNTDDVLLTSVGYGDDKCKVYDTCPTSGNSPDGCDSCERGSICFRPPIGCTDTSTCSSGEYEEGSATGVYPEKKPNGDPIDPERLIGQPLRWVRPGDPRCSLSASPRPHSGLVAPFPSSDAPEIRLLQL